MPNQSGLGHIAFEVYDVEGTKKRALASGGTSVGSRFQMGTSSRGRACGTLRAISSSCSTDEPRTEPEHEPGSENLEA
jgi:hypothetical protein